MSFAAQETAPVDCAKMHRHLCWPIDCPCCWLAVCVSKLAAELVCCRPATVAIRLHTIQAALCISRYADAPRWIACGAFLARDDPLFSTPWCFSPLHTDTTQESGSSDKFDKQYWLYVQPSASRKTRSHTYTVGRENDCTWQNQQAPYRAAEFARVTRQSSVPV